MMGAMITSPLAPKHMPDMPLIQGVSLMTKACAIRYQDRDDLSVMIFDHPVPIAGMFTRSTMASAHVTSCKSHLQEGQARLVIVIAGNANACTGLDGEEAVTIMVHHAASLWSCKKEEVFICATGVIGEPLDPHKICQHLSDLKSQDKKTSWPQWTHAIHTTDTFAKYATRALHIEGKKYTINGVVKGSGMIAPNMATMLSFIVTDVNCAHQTLQDMLHQAVEQSFQAISVDTDSSTNDTILCVATGTSENAINTQDKKNRFQEALTSLCQELALLVIKDGEGATSVIEVQVEQAASDADAKAIARSVAESPLVKTAIAGRDPNWGRIMMAIGKTNIPIDQNALTLSIGPHKIAQYGKRSPTYNEEEIAAYMQQHTTIVIHINIGSSGKGEAHFWSCDLTHGYIQINADYRS